MRIENKIPSPLVVNSQSIDDDTLLMSFFSHSFEHLILHILPGLLTPMFRGVKAHMKIGFSVRILRLFSLIASTKATIRSYTKLPNLKASPSRLLFRKH